MQEKVRDPLASSVSPGPEIIEYIVGKDADDNRQGIRNPGLMRLPHGFEKVGIAKPYKTKVDNGSACADGCKFDNARFLRQNFFQQRCFSLSFLNG
jgi:hypothetical protein